MASSLHDDDAAFLVPILGTATVAPTGEAWAFVRRGGRVLLACHPDRNSLLRALALYQPQRPGARLMRAALAAGAPWGVVKYLPSRRFTATTGGPLESIARQHGVSITAILFGNPSQPERRAILLATGRQPLVFKLGTHPLAVAAVRREAAFLDIWGGRLPAIPALKAEETGDGWHAFAVEYLDGRAVGELDLAAVTAVLEQWLLPEAPKRACDFASWQAIDAERLPADKAHAFLELGNRLMLRPSLAHHDLAPWNLLRTAGQRVVAIDWENGEARGVPGWDLVHFLFQIGSLVKRLAPAALLDDLQDSLVTAASRRFLDAAGWGGEIPWLVASYLAHRIAAGDEGAREAMAVALQRVQPGLDSNP